MHITRLSPITLGVLALAIVVFGTASLALWRSRHRAPIAAAPQSQELGETSRWAPGDRAPPPGPSAPSAVPSAPAQPALAGASDPPAAMDLTSEQTGVDAGARAVDNTVAVQNRQRLVAAHNLQLIVQADEQAFVSLKLADDTRVAIRKIDEDFGNRARAALNVAPDQTTVDRQIGLGIAGNDQAERDRRSAIRTLLGPEGATDFETAEYAEARRLRIRYRRQWAEELDATAPWPEGVPRSAH